MKKNWSVRMLTEAGIFIALSIILGRIKIFNMPQGGSVTAGQMIPLIIFAMRHGAGPGIVVGAVYGLIDMLLGDSMYHPIQILLDYPIAFGALGLAGLFSSDFMTNKK